MSERQGLERHSRAAVLKVSPGEKDAVVCKAVILIELSRFEEAIEHIEEHAANFKDFSFEKVKPY